MKINIDGVTRDMTPEEITEFERQQAEMPEPEPTPEEIAEQAYLTAEYTRILVEFMMEG